MTEENRGNSDGDGAPTSSTKAQPSAHGQDEHGMGSASRTRSHRDQAEMADDRGRDRDRRSFSGDREHDELGSEMEDGGAIDSDSFDDELGDERQSER